MGSKGGRHLARWAGVVALVAIAACGGGGGDGGDERAGGANDADDHELRAPSCDVARARGTITNRAGEPAAFRVTVRYTYQTGSGLELQHQTTPVLSDDEEFDFSIGPDVAGSSPSSCVIVGAQRVEADEADVAEVEQEEAEAPEASEEAQLEPVWEISDVAGAIKHASVHDGDLFLAVDTPEGATVFKADLASSEIDWQILPEHAVTGLVADQRGGVVLLDGIDVVSIDAAGEEAWRSTPLRSQPGVMASSIDQVAVHDGTVVVSGAAPGSVAELDLADGETQWYLKQDETGAPNPTGFMGGGDFLAVDDNHVLVSGGPGGQRRLAMIDRTGPEVVWSVEEASGLVAWAEDTVVMTSGPIRAFEATSGDELWSVDDPDWERSPAMAAPRLIDDVVVVQRAGESTGFDLADGEQRWRSTDTDTMFDWSVPEDRYVNGTGDTDLDGRAVGLRTALQLLLLSSDGSLLTVDVPLTGPMGTLTALETDGPLVFVAARGSTTQQDSRMWVVDLRDL